MLFRFRPLFWVFREPFWDQKCSEIAHGPNVRQKEWYWANTSNYHVFKGFYRTEAAQHIALRRILRTKNGTKNELLKTTAKRRLLVRIRGGFWRLKGIQNTSKIITKLDSQLKPTPEPGPHANQREPAQPNPYFLSKSLPKWLVLLYIIYLDK